MGAKILRWNIALWNMHVSKACFQHENQRGKWALLLYMASLKLPKSFYGLQNRNFMISPKWNRFRVIRWYVFIITSIWTYHCSINHVISVTWFISHVIHKSRDLDPVITPKRPFLLKILKWTQKKTAKNHQNRQFAQWLELILWEHSHKECMNFELWRHWYDS